MRFLIIFFKYDFYLTAIMIHIAIFVFVLFLVGLEIDSAYIIYAYIY